MTRRLTLSALLVVTAVVSACQDAVTDVARPETRRDALDPTPLDTTIISRSALGDIASLVGATRPDAPGGSTGLAPDAGTTAIYPPLETTVVLYYVIEWLYQNGLLDAVATIEAVTPVVDAYVGLITDDIVRAVTGFATFVTTVTGHVNSGAVSPPIGQWLIDLAMAAIQQLVPGWDVPLELEVVASGLDDPLYLTAPANDPRLFIVTKNGTIRIVQSGQLLPTPFLDISSKVSTGGEQGLLSVAFDPSYSTNGFLYVYYTNLDGDNLVERYEVSASSNVADPASAEQILFVSHPSFSNHNGGHVFFGPDGMLYVAIGDGGSGGANGQNLSTILGKLLRIDVSQGDPYAIPSDNPFVNQSGARGEIWAYGLRNPWRNAFDRADGRLYVADVGENALEEVNVVSSSTGGVNYGWSIMEGDQCYNASSCNQTGLTPPVLTYTHDDGCSITGGIVYRGQRIQELRGHYFYGDFCSGWVRSFRFANGQATDQRSWDVGSVGNILSFGEDAAGEMYLLSANGSVYRFVKAS
jgi:glucose/arabinose dehydrogenase